MKFVIYRFQNYNGGGKIYPSSLWDLLDDLVGPKGIAQWDSICTICNIDFNTVDDIFGFDNRAADGTQSICNHVCMYQSHAKTQTVTSITIVKYQLLWENNAWRVIVNRRI